MDGGAGDGHGYVGEKRCTARFHQDAAGQKILEPDDEHARINEVDTEMTSPVRKMERPFLTLAATDWEMAVWMEPAQMEKQMP